MTPTCPLGCTLHEVSQRLTDAAGEFIRAATPKILCNGRHRKLPTEKEWTAGKRRWPLADPRERCAGGHGLIYALDDVLHWTTHGRLPKEPWA